jgi:hypothetical protein
MIFLFKEKVEDPRETFQIFVGHGFSRAVNERFQTGFSRWPFEFESAHLLFSLYDFYATCFHKGDAVKIPRGNWIPRRPAAKAEFIPCAFRHG